MYPVYRYCSDDHHHCLWVKYRVMVPLGHPVPKKWLNHY